MAKKLGRPTDYTKAKAEEICQRTANGEPLASICSDEHMPHISVVYDWERAHPDFTEDRARARTDQADTYADKIANLGLKVERGEIEPKAADSARNSFAWVAQRANPQRYSEQQKIEHSGDVQVKVYAGFDPTVVMKPPEPPNDSDADADSAGQS